MIPNFFNISQLFLLALTLWFVYPCQLFFSQLSFLGHFHFNFNFFYYLNFLRQKFNLIFFSHALNGIEFFYVLIVSHTSLDWWETSNVIVPTALSRYSNVLNTCAQLKRLESSKCEGKFMLLSKDSFIIELSIQLCMPFTWSYHWLSHAQPHIHTHTMCVW